MEHLVAQCYIRDPKFCLHLNLVFLVVILSKQNTFTSSIMSLSQYVGSLYKSLAPEAEWKNEAMKQGEELTFII